MVLEYSADPAKEAILTGVLIDEAQKVVACIPQAGSDLVIDSKESVEHFVESMAHLVGSLSNALAKLSYFGGIARARLVSDSIERIGQACLNQERVHPTGGLGLLPATIVSYAAVLGACLGQQMDILAHLLLKPRLIAADGSRNHWATQFNTLTTFENLEQRRLVPGNYIRQYGGGLLLRTALESLPFAQLASCPDRFMVAFETAEYAIGLVCQLFSDESFPWSAPAGTLVEYFRWMSDDRRRKALLDSIAESGLRKALQECSPHDVDTASLEKADTDFRSKLQAYGHSVP
jgi:hypothetical protein